MRFRLKRGISSVIPNYYEYSLYILTTIKMAAADIQLLVNTIFYIAIFVGGFVVSIPVGVVNVS